MKPAPARPADGHKCTDICCNRCHCLQDAEREDKCRPVEVDGEVIRVLGGREMSAVDRAMFADVVRAARRKFAAEDEGDSDV